MADISGQDFLSGLAGQFGTTTRNTEFVSDSLRAVNRAIKDVNIRADLQTQLAGWPNAEAAIPVDDAYDAILNTGVIFHMVRQGRQYKAVDTRNVPTLKQWQTDWNEAIDEWRQDIVNDLDPDEDDIIGLGVTSY